MCRTGEAGAHHLIRARLIADLELADLELADLELADLELADTARRAFDWVGTLAADVVGRALSTPHGVTWSNAEHTRTPPELPPEPGFMQGAAGIAAWLARFRALE